jgi:Uma2 family endonuclease
MDKRTKELLNLSTYEAEKLNEHLEVNESAPIYENNDDLLQTPIKTIDDIYALPEGERAELIDGKLYYMATPKTVHQRILTKLTIEIGNFIKAKKGPCEVLPAPYGVFLKADDSVFVEPDISVICDPEKIDEKGCIGAPDWIIEIISPSSASHDYVRKFVLYNKAGVREYWIVDPRNNTVTVHFFDTEEYIPLYYTFKDKVKVNIYDDFVIDFMELL